MLYNLLAPLADQISLFNLFNYITVRAGGAMGTAFLLSLLFGERLITYFRTVQKQKNTVRTDHPESSVQSKAGTPSMGGLLILATFFMATFLWTDLTSPYVWMLLAIAFTFGLVGFIDDYLGMTRGRNKGLSGKVRLAIQSVVSGFVVWMLIQLGGESATSIYIPFFKHIVLDPGVYGFIIFAIFVMIGSANAVNLTDGLDGLVSVPAAVVAGAFAGVAYIVGRVDYTEYLGIAYIAGAGEVAIVCAALAGAMLGFLWFNAPPARIFMGDTGALPVGALLGTVAVILKQEFMLAIIGGIFVLETVSVIVQVASFKLTGKRVFRMAPLHHHFEHKGWPETTIVVRFWIISIILAVIGLATLKLR